MYNRPTAGWLKWNLTLVWEPILPVYQVELVRENRSDISLDMTICSPDDAAKIFARYLIRSAGLATNSIELIYNVRHLYRGFCRKIDGAAATGKW